MKLSDRLLELAGTLDACNRHNTAFCVITPTLATMEEVVIVMKEAARELEDWAKVEYER